jgi:hypothetical protein
MTSTLGKEILGVTHFIAGLGGSLFTLLFFPKRKTQGAVMANKFVSILKDVGKGLLFIFTNKTAENIEAGALNLAGLIWPGLQPFLGKLSNAIANAQAQALVSTAGMSDEQIIALVLTDMNADFETAGITETSHQQQIVAQAIGLIDLFPSGSVNAAVVNAAVSQAVAQAKAAPAAPAPAAPAAAAVAAPAPAVVAQAGPGLDQTVPA